MSERGEAGREGAPWISLERGFRLHVICPPLLFLPTLPSFKVDRSRDYIYTDTQTFTAVCRVSCFSKITLEGITALNEGWMQTLICPELQGCVLPACSERTQYMIASPVTPAPAKPLRAELIYISVNATSCFPGVLVGGSLKT